MSDFEPRDWLTERMRAMGSSPVDSATQSKHLTEMAEAAAAPSLLGTLGSRIRIAAAVGVGVLLGATGLAGAGALGPLQPIASQAVEAATPLEVPDGKGKSADAHAANEARKAAKADDANGKGVERVTEGCEDGISTRNRGQYLKGIRDKYGNDSPELAAAKLTRCGMPVNSEGSPGSDDDDAAGAVDAENGKADDTHGKSAEAPGQDVKGTNGEGAGKPSDVPGEGKGLDGGKGSREPQGPPASTPVGPPADTDGS